jgi:hypothetical protein
MTAVWFRARAELRARWRASIGLALVIGLAGGMVIAAAAGARRQDSTFPKFRDATNTAQTGVVNSGAFFGFADVDFARAEKLPQVVDSAPWSAFVGFARSSRGVEITPLADQNPVVFFASPDDRYDRVINRMVALEGRLPDPDSIDEVAISYIGSQQYGIYPGDKLDLTLPTFKDLRNSQNPNFQPTGPHLRLRVVGTEATSFELPPGLGYPPLHLTPAFYRTYISKIPSFQASLFMLRNDGDLPSFIADIQRTALKPGGNSNRVQFFNEPANAVTIRRTLHVQATALWLLALLAGIASVLIIAQAIVRQTFLESDEHPALHALGMTPGQLFGTTVARLLFVAIIGCVLAVAVSIAVSPLTPLGLARLVDLHPGLSVDVRATAIGCVALLAVIFSLGAFAAIRSSSSQISADPAREHPSRIADSLARASFSPSSVAGVRMALETGRGRTAVPVRSTLFGAVVGLAALVTAFVFGSSLTHLLNTPRLVGWNWDATLGNSFDADDAARVLPVLARDDAVAEYSAGGGSSVRVGSKTFTVSGQDPIKGQIEPLILEGRPPRALDEIALGGLTLNEIDARVGDLIQVQIEGSPVTMKIVGRAVVPPIEETSSSGGEGGFVTFQGLRRLQPTASEDVFTARFAAGADPIAARDKLKAALPGVAVDISPDVGSATDFGRIVNLPVILAALLALLAAATLIHTLLTIVRRRARDLAILKTLGFVRSQVRAAVAWQVTTLVLVALIIAIPAGLAAGRWSWTTFANQVGFVPESVVRLLPILITIPAALVFGNLIAMIPARAAAHTSPAEVFRTE